MNEWSEFLDDVDDCLVVFEVVLHGDSCYREGGLVTAKACKYFHFFVGKQPEAGETHMFYDNNMLANDYS